MLTRSVIYGVTINGERNIEFSYDDPNMQIFSSEDPRQVNGPSFIDSLDDRFEILSFAYFRRDLTSFLKRQQRFSEYVDPDEGNGELTIFIPPSLQQTKSDFGSSQEQTNTEVVYKVTIDFSLEQPESGIHFFVPNDDAKLSRVSSLTINRLDSID